MADPAADHSSPDASRSHGSGKSSDSHDVSKAGNAPRKKPRRKRSWRHNILRATIVILLMVPILVVSLYFIATRSWFIIAAVTPTLENRLGGEVGIGHASYEGDGTFMFEDFRLRVRGMHGLGAEVMHVASMEVQVNMDKLFKGDVEILSGRVEGLLLRASEDANAPGEFNFMLLKHTWENDPDFESLHVPRVEIPPATLEMGMHDGADYKVVGQARVAGQLHRVSDDDSVFSFELGEVDENGNGLGANGVVINGQWDSKTFEYTGRIDGLKLDDKARSMCPQMTRLYWDRMQLEGAVGSASVRYREGEPLHAELTMENGGLTMPVYIPGLWSIYRAGEVLDTEARPRLLNAEVKIVMDGESLTIDARKAELAGSEPEHSTVSVPIRLTLTVPELPKLAWEERTQWMDQILATLPFEMSLRIDDFTFDPATSDRASWLELPTTVARMFSLFEMTGWQLSTQIDVSREPATIDADGNLRAGAIHPNGRAFIRHASGRYRRFPYQLTDVEAYIEFDNEKCDVHYLNGRGGKDSTVRIAGSVTPPTREGAVDLRIDATNVPLDGRLRQALTDKTGAIFDALFNEAAFEKLSDAGLITTAEDITAMRHRMNELALERAALQQESDERSPDERSRKLAAIDTEMTRVQAVIDAGPFQLGGIVDLDLNVEKKYGLGNPAIITGGVNIHSAGILYEKFPYPITFNGGSLDWQEDSVRINAGDVNKGLTLTTAGGGRGVLSGQLLLQQDDEGHVHGEPAFSFTVAGDQINPMLLAAIPADRTQSVAVEGESAQGMFSRSRATRLLHGMGLSGSLDCSGNIAASAGEPLRYDFLIGLNHGASVPTPDVASIMSEIGLRWPEGFSLERVEGMVRVTPGAIELVDLTGHRGEGEVRANGTLDLSGKGGNAALDVEFKSLALEQYLVNLAPADGVARAQQLWDTYRPQGTFDARLRYVANDASPGIAELVVQPNVLRIVADNKPVSLFRRSGNLSLHENEVRLDGLELEVQTGSRSDGVLVLDGSYGTSIHGQVLSVSGAWGEGLFECPLIPEVMQLIGAKNETSKYQAMMPAGSFDAQFSYRSPRGDEPTSYSFTVKPHSIAMVLDQTVLSATLSPSSEIRFTPGLIEFNDVAGEHPGGTFNLDGQIALTAAPVIDLDLEYRGDLVSQQVWVLLPESVRGALREIQFHSSQAGRVSDAKLRLTQVPETDTWSMDFSGLVETGSCSFNVGMPFTDVDGLFRVSASQPAAGEASVKIRAEANRLRVLNREMTNLTANMEYSQADQEVTISDMRGELYGGVVSAEGSIGVGGGRRDYDMRVVAAGVLLDQISKAESLAATESEVQRMERKTRERETDSANAQQGGQLFASLDLAGERGEEFTRTGRGKLRIVGGEVANLSLTLRVLQLMQFIPPFSDTMDYADVEYYVSGDRVVFERILLEIPFMDRAALQLLGEGEMDYNTFELNTRFRGRGTIPMLSALVGEVSDRLYQIEVTGPLTDPVARLRALPDLTGSKAIAIGGQRTERIVQESVE